MVEVMYFHKEVYVESLKKLTYATVSGSSSPRGRIYDRNYNIIVDNKALKNITYQKKKGVTAIEMIELAKKISPHLEIDYSKISERNKREYYYDKNKENCDEFVTEEEKEKVKQRKMTLNELNELKINRIPDDELNFSDEENKIAYIYYLMNRGYTYEEKIIKSNATEKEFAYVSENNEELDGFHTKLDWERIYPYENTLKSIFT